MTGCRASGISVLWGTDFLCIQSGLPTAYHLIEARSPYPSFGTPASAIAAGKDINHGITHSQSQKICSPVFRTGTSKGARFFGQGGETSDCPSKYGF